MRDDAQNVFVRSNSKSAMEAPTIAFLKPISPVSAPEYRKNRGTFALALFLEKLLDSPLTGRLTFPPEDDVI